VSNLLAKIGLGDLLHLAKNHGRDFFRGELLVLAADLDLNIGLAILGNNLVGEVLDVSLDILLAELATDKTPAR